MKTITIPVRKLTEGEMLELERHNLVSRLLPPADTLEASEGELDVYKRQGC